MLTDAEIERRADEILRPHFYHHGKTQDFWGARAAIMAALKEVRDSGDADWKVLVDGLMCGTKAVEAERDRMREALKKVREQLPRKSRAVIMAVVDAALSGGETEGKADERNNECQRCIYGQRSFIECHRPNPAHCEFRPMEPSKPKCPCEKEKECDDKIQPVHCPAGLEALREGKGES